MINWHRTLSILVLIFCFFIPPSQAQSNSLAAPRVFLDCQTRCYFSHVRTELDYIYFVRDRQEANVYLMLSGLRTGAGGRQFSLVAIGQGELAEISDTTVFFAKADVTESVEQDIVVNGIRNALLPFIMKTDLAKYVTVDVNVPDEIEMAAETMDDPWNSWVFRVGGNAHMSAVETSQNVYLETSASASRVTEASKFTSWFNYEFRQEKFDLEEEEFVSIVKSYNSNMTYVKSISEHWSVGSFLRVWSNTFTNFDLGLSIQPAVEYNLFPYKEATTRQFTFEYRVGPSYNRYVDSTIFDKKSEWVCRQNLSVYYKRLETWGTASFYFNYGNYLHDWELMSLSIHPRIEWNLAKGLSLDVNGGISLIRDQINIVKSEVSDEERLLHIKQLQTNFRVNGSIGLTYRFGSSNNNIVNTRL